MKRNFFNELKKNWIEFKNDTKTCIKELKNKETRKKQIPNMFTASRLFAPFFIIPTALLGNIPLTIIFSISFALTDFADGFFARKYNASSEYGRKLDPITDKVFAGSLLIPLIIINPFVIINLIGEIIIALINTNSQLNNNLPKTVYLGKIKTTALYTTIALSYVSLALGILPSVINPFVIGTSLLQGASAYEYFKKYKDEEKLKELKKHEEEYQKILSDEDTNKDNVLSSQKKPLSNNDMIRDLKVLRESIINENDKESNNTEEKGFQNIKRKK